MAATYYHITVDEFERVMDDFDAERVDVPRTKEFVYHVPTDKEGLVVRVFSSLTGRGSRDAGKDAIRVFAWSLALDAPVARAVRTHRIDTWEDNLRPKIEDMVERVEAGEFDGETPDGELAGLVPAEHDEEGVVVITDLADTRYGRKLVLDSPYEAKDAIKGLDWDETHRSWDDRRDAWTADAEAAPEVIEHLESEGWPVRFGRKEDPDAFDFWAFIQNAMEGDVVDITYDTKTSDSVKTIRVEITAVVPWDTVEVSRTDDNHPMRVEEPGELFTAGSHYPFVGEVEGVEMVEMAHQ